jgi:hypothetical protein
LCSWALSSCRWRPSPSPWQLWISWWQPSGKRLHHPPKVNLYLRCIWGVAKLCSWMTCAACHAKENDEETFDCTSQVARRDGSRSCVCSRSQHCENRCCHTSAIEVTL